MTKYMKAIDGDLLIRDEKDDGVLERYDPATGKWVFDFELSRIYFGSLLVKDISKSEAMQLMKRR